MEPIRIAPLDLAARAGDSSLRILDVRTAGEYESVHIPGSYNVPLDTLGEHAAEVAGATGDFVLVCQSGARARQAEEILRKAGVTNLHLLEGGMNAWLQQGGTVRRGRRRMSLERQVRIGAGTLVVIGAALALSVDIWFALIPLLVGSGLVFAGVTDICMMATLLARFPWNREASCDSAAVVTALISESSPPERQVASSIGN